ncbi:unnamed protein product [Prunus armeniaca]|uniref:VQ domain-containing protein n=1 Tax=Prunus armeniaca TaxID=36596 RepID=A0A6J5UMD7_PRUAR|nr:hypothetical protein GBA52_013578 [Prunus armeniaca]CAB4277132.1 unnamed protein product [Prunus armeniaca]
MSSGNQCVKVVVINTKYVETDVMSFKDVVQKLTGKDSNVAYEMQEPNNVAKSQCFLRDQGINNYGGRTNVNVMESSNDTSCSVNGGKTTTMSRSSSSVVMKNISFKEFERLFREMPPVEDFWID